MTELKASRASVGALLAAAWIAVAGLAGCGSEEAPSPRDDGGPSTPAPAGQAVEISLSSPAFGEGTTIPRKYTVEGEDVSPPLAWSGLPPGTKELALICEDPDAPDPANPRPDPWVHWVIYKIPADAAGLPEGIPKTQRPSDPAGALQGANSWPAGQDLGYGGPAPPPGTGPHRYFFRLYALDTGLAVEPGLDKAALLRAMEGHVVGEGRLMGTYAR